jgi:hypothetical protein
MLAVHRAEMARHPVCTEDVQIVVRRRLIQNQPGRRITIRHGTIAIECYSIPPIILSHMRIVNDLIIRGTIHDADAQCRRLAIDNLAKPAR